jgi:hypothetical protein
MACVVAVFDGVVTDGCANPLYDSTTRSEIGLEND